ncbi:hypothetical protein F4803DRAFT_364571 [Xylaria telfairii]|nr:hypothetical protein EV127DRAFT_408522 [Xylaria flabelliformis]KAI0447281.1 hypothetical protein F4803DRAFT_364571 [Xylaria telfairii]
MPAKEEIVSEATAKSPEPPIGWTGDIDDEEYWGPKGTIWSLLIMAGIDSTGMKPLYTREAWAGGCVTLLQSGSSPKYYFHSAIDDSIHRVTGLQTLDKIVEWMNDEDRGYQAILTEKVL